MLVSQRVNPTTAYYGLYTPELRGEAIVSLTQVWELFLGAGHRARFGFAGQTEITWENHFAGEKNTWNQVKYGVDNRKKKQNPLLISPWEHWGLLP